VNNHVTLRLVSEGLFDLGDLLRNYAPGSALDGMVVTGGCTGCEREVSRPLRWWMTAPAICDCCGKPLSAEPVVEVIRKERARNALTTTGV
jgi:hypothetical protein